MKKEDLFIQDTYYFAYKNCYEAKSDKKRGTILFQQFNFSFCKKLNCWLRWGVYVFRFNEVLWVLGGNFVDLKDDTNLKEITDQIIKLTGNLNFEKVLKETEIKMQNWDNKMLFQKWEVSEYRKINKP